MPIDDRNGIITRYNVYIKKSIDSAWPAARTQQQQSYEKTGLLYWTIYDVKLSAKTSKGEGVQSNVTQIRTDEDSESFI